MKYYTEEHEWIEVQDGVGTVGISRHAAEELGDITFIELPRVGTSFRQGDVASVVESVKAASDIYAPIAGTVNAVNEKLVERPEVVNESAEGDGWIFRLDGVDETELGSLMKPEAYAAFLRKETGP